MESIYIANEPVLSSDEEILLKKISKKYYRDYRAGRSEVDRFLGMEEARGSIPLQSILNSAGFAEDCTFKQF